jgi:hypothetical protein
MISVLYLTPAYIAGMMHDTWFIVVERGYTNQAFGMHIPKSVVLPMYYLTTGNLSISPLPPSKPNHYGSNTACLQCIK